MLDEVKSLWQYVDPQTQLILQDLGLALGAFLSGHLLGTMVARSLRAKRFDALLRLPASTPAGPDADNGITPSLVTGLLIRLTFWAGAFWWLAYKHGQVEMAGTVLLAMRRTWAIALVLAAALGLGSLVARRLIDCLHGLAKAEPESPMHRATATSSYRGAAGVVGAIAYVLAVLLVLLITADSFDWPLTRSSAQALWTLAQHLLTAGAALLIGWLGARWARDVGIPEGTATPEKRAGQYTALGIVAATTLLAVAVLLSSAGVLLGLAALTLVGLVLWLLRGYLPDVTAGLQLRAHKVREIWLDRSPWQLVEVGLLSTQVSRAGEFWRLQNRRVLEARLHGTPSEAAVR
jgi:hypothetical protein